MSISQIAEPYQFFATIGQNANGEFGGGGNGFPFSSVNWDARFRNTDDKPRENVMDFDQAVKVFWNLYGVNATVSGDTKSASFARATASSTPIDRTLVFAVYTDTDSDNGTSGVDFASISLSSNSDFVIYYAGLTDNIVGYGFEDFIEAKAHRSATVGSQTGTTQHNVKIQSHFDNLQSNTSTSTRTETYTYEDIKISGIPFVKETEVIKIQLGGNLSICPDPGEITISDLDFFQY
jgi:hypothetical protein